MTRDELARRMYAVVENPDDWDREPETYRERYLRMADAAIETMKPTTTTPNGDQVVWALIAAMERNYAAQQDADIRRRNVWTQALIETAAASQLDSILDRIRFAADMADYVLSSYDSKWGAK